MRQVFRTIFVSLALFGTAEAVQAQGLLKRLVDRATQQVEQEAETAVRDTISSGLRGGAGGRDPVPEEPTSDAEGGGETNMTQPAPAAPVRATAGKAGYIDDLRVAPDIEAQKASYNKFGEVSCNDCEGGIDFDGRPKFSYDQFSGQYGERAKRVGSWPLGHVHRWQGRASKGTLTIAREEQVEGFRCRRLEYRLEKAGASASRPGLICFGLANRSSEIENWHEIY
ncbi:hypothetical protein SAMN05428974_2095 [Sphingopyxis sp. YR583]|jgi:hypothetical protein|uniref:hypothetical protein n=1 Tax=Sphingopyxis sp. YR583 TaxID=1881047 RepID=UPI0008A7E6A3|nr:hypothetical protein [Sphingopyxis sp. YR583]SEH17234.1 hypothetical protein SAMN05428974_2095 [Sphingopyxis sp. YR583]